MSDDEVDHELLDLLRKSLGMGPKDPAAPPETKVLESAQSIYDNSIDVALDMRHTKVSAISLYEEMQKRSYSTKTWSEHPLHPKAKDEATVNFIFTMDLLNFSFWSEKSASERFSVAYGKADGDEVARDGLEKAEEKKRADVDKLKKELDELQQKLGSLKAEGEQKLATAKMEVEIEKAIGMDEEQKIELGGEQKMEVDEKQKSQANEEQKMEVDDKPTTEEEKAEKMEVEEDKKPETDVNKHTKRWTGYWSLVAALQRALDDGIPITSPDFWVSEQCSDDVLRQVFRSETDEEMPMFQERVNCLREAGRVLVEEFDSSVAILIDDAKKSAAGLVNLLAERFSCFRDEAKFEGKKVRFLKRAQIFVADLWAAFDGESYGEFHDIDKITMFADYRVPQMLHSLGCMSYCPPLEGKIRRLESIPPGHAWEIQIRGCSIWAIELIRREIMKLDPNAKVNAILIDFFLYDLAKERELAGEEAIPHHRTRSIWY